LLFGNDEVPREAPEDVGHESLCLGMAASAEDLVTQEGIDVVCQEIEVFRKLAMEVDIRSCPRLWKMNQSGFVALRIST
jgi:hypothetical protein